MWVFVNLKAMPCSIIQYTCSMIVAVDFAKTIVHIQMLNCTKYWW